MRILIAGGSGYVGSLIVPGLAGAGHEVRILDPAAPGVDAAWLEGSATDPSALAAGLSGADAVIHAAMARPGPDGAPDPVSSFSVLVTSVFTTLDAAARAGVSRAVLISSLSVYADEPVPVTDRDIDETSPPDAADVYGLAKRLAEIAGQVVARAHGMTVTVLRIGWPTTGPAWPAWALPDFPQPAVIRRADGTAIPARDRDGGFDVFHIVRNDASGRCLSTAKARTLLGWYSRRC
jgi:nucleoside-diphosphate-sugar epimerase